MSKNNEIKSNTEIERIKNDMLNNINIIAKNKNMKSLIMLHSLSKKLSVKKE